MDLIQTGFSCEYDMEIFVNLFFDKEDEGIIMTNLSHENDIINVYIEILFKGKSYFGDYSYPFTADLKNENAVKKNYTCSVTKAFCSTAKKIRRVDLPWGVMSGIRPAKVARKYMEEGYSHDEVKNIFTNLYNTSEKKAELAMLVADNEKKILSDIDENSVSIYIGIPFCPTRCLYCSFVSTDIRKSGKYMDEFVRLLLKEIEKTAEVMKKCGLYAENIYIGGGTPTTLSAENLNLILNHIKKYFITDKMKEFTLEAGRPDTIDEEKLLTAKKYGVNRISINPQTMNDVTLKKIGRCHTSDMIREKYDMARKCGFENINMDLIAGLPDETVDMFRYSLKEVEKLNPENITIHSMCIKKAALLRFSGIELTKSKNMNIMLDFAMSEMKKSGRVPYYMYRQKNISGNLENVGYAKKECMSFYNVNIMEEAQTIIALGGGAVTKIVIGDRIERIFNFKDPYEYINRFDEILKKKEEILKYYNL
ncbi:MAG: coproporphyrinogen dehydrogenase HemZ [Clostridia bacterium]|nr:coproporphyrinogen dehydrogenase HemZ [Clostridia bacterium]